MSGEAEPVKLHLRTVAQRVLEARRRRTRFLPNAIFNEIAWEVLLSLYAAPHGTEPLSVAPGRPPSVTSRWIDYLVGEGLVTRLSAGDDRNAVKVALSEAGARSIEDCLSDFAQFIMDRA
jgi:DNA-binding MarR family transcriptional regulator